MREHRCKTPELVHRESCTQGVEVGHQHSAQNQFVEDDEEAGQEGHNFCLTGLEATLHEEFEVDPLEEPAESCDSVHRIKPIVMQQQTIP